MAKAIVSLKQKSDRRLKQRNNNTDIFNQPMGWTVEKARFDSWGGQRAFPQSSEHTIEALLVQFCGANPVRF